ncbi:hypothetical protein AYO44_01865 [Planctomycetaceae bacterium SCGC AG-212-F19]|nr:hypothetical protein AYO44_01865 [Planctomycetaceae bacterium SCGC AG-212-F19]
MSEFDDLDEGGEAPRKRKRRYTAWLWLILVACFAGLGALLYFQYGVWVHPIHAPNDLDIIELYLNERLAGDIQITVAEPLRTVKGEPLLRVKYRRKNRSGPWVPPELGWVAEDQVFYVKDGRVAWALNYEHWKISPE